MLCMSAITSLKVRQPNSHETHFAEARARISKADSNVSHHMGGSVTVLKDALDTAALCDVLENHWGELRQLSLGDEGFDKVGRSPPFYR